MMISRGALLCSVSSQFRCLPEAQPPLNYGAECQCSSGMKSGNTIITRTTHNAHEGNERRLTTWSFDYPKDARF